MASKTEETPQKEEMPEKEGPETLPDSPLLNLSDPAVKELIRSAKKRGCVTHDQINSVLPYEEVNSEQIKDVLAIFSKIGVNFVETEETSKEGEEPREEADEEARSESSELIEIQQKVVPAKSETNESTDSGDVRKKLCQHRTRGRCGRRLFRRFPRCRKLGVVGPIVRLNQSPLPDNPPAAPSSAESRRRLSRPNRSRHWQMPR
jgi:Sigma-70 factor, region 1.1